MNELLPGGGEMGERIRAFDWSSTPLGPIGGWSQSLKTAVRILVESRYPMFVWWGPELVNVYNDAYAPMLGARHPHALGGSAPEIWADVWPVVGPQTAIVLEEGRSTWNESILLMMERSGYLEEAYFTFSYSPAPDDSGRVGGVFCAVSEDTERVIGERRLALLRDLGTATPEARTWQDACERSVVALRSNDRDLPFALLYVAEPGASSLELAGSVGLDIGHPAAPATVELDATHGWPLARAVGARDPVLLADLEPIGDLRPATGPWDVAPSHAALVPIASSGETARRGVLVVGLNPHRPFDEGYRSFLALVGGQVSANIAGAEAYEQERRRAEALAELDRAKTAFFSNLSHEFRTPLTLILGPVEELLDDASADGPGASKEQLEVVRRNGLRLLKLVNTMLDFSRIEAGRLQASYEPVDLAASTAELASVFRSAIERAGLRLVIDCEPLPEPVYVDRDMWENIVLNLLSNAFKFTLEGEIEVGLAVVAGRAQLSVSDTGVGVPADELPRVFERFHRVEETRGRTHEGTGIGLSLVQELVKLHGGDVRIESALDEGSTVVVDIPFGSAHLDAARVVVGLRTEAPATHGDAFVEEAMRWLAVDQDGALLEAESALDPIEPRGGARPRVVWADDNADMRDYVVRLLRPRFDVEAVADGELALEAARRSPPVLILTDVMMPRLDGVGLLRKVRADSALRNVPVILVSARAGEGARIEGLEAGADDYLVKPFSARELVAVVESQVRMSKIRRETEDALRLSAERDRFVTALGDALRPLSNPTAIQGEATRLVGEHLGADRVGYAETDASGEVMTVARDWVRPGVRSVVGAYRIDDVGTFFTTPLRQGQASVIEDAADHPLISPETYASAWSTIGVRSAIAYPLIKEGCFVAALFVHQSDARTWSEAEVALVSDVAERMWAAVERQRAEEELRGREEKYRAVFDSIDEGFCFVEMIFDDDGRPVDYLFLEVNPVFELHTGLRDPVGRTARELVPGLEEHWVEIYGAVALTGESRRFSEGSDVMGRYFDVYAARVGGESSRQVAIVFRDVTAAKAAAESLRESEERFRELAQVEQQARGQAELLSELVAELEAVGGVRARAGRLVELLASRVADHASVRLPDETEPVARGVGEPQLELPLALGRNAFGVLCLGRRDGEPPFGAPEEVALAGEIAARAGLLLANARVQEEEHQIALRLQRALLPSALVGRANVHIAARYEATSDVLEVGGDWYDSFSLEGGRIGLAVGDVVGHGLEAAAAMGRLRTALAALATQTDDAGALMTALDRFANGANGADFATACYAILDPETGTVRYASAGHPPMLLVAPDGATRWLDEGRALPLGVALECTRTEATVTLDPGATLVLYSDGLVERRGERISAGLARLERVAASCAELSVDEACDRLLAEMSADVAGDDDIVVLCVRRTPVPAGFRFAFPGRAEELAGVRAAVGAWLDEREVAPAERATLLLAVGEACSNAIEHAYPDEHPGTVEVELGEQEGAILVLVRDFGLWRVRSDRNDDRGRGTAIMQSLTDDFRRESDASGTTVRFRIFRSGRVPA